MNPERLVHHELCFGCGRTNLFGLLMELAPAGDGAVRGRGFVKQDHQGPVPGTAHEGIIAAALSEAMAFAAGPDMRPASFTFELQSAVPVGAFIEVEASVEETERGECETSSAAHVGDQEVARARGRYRRS